MVQVVLSYVLVTVTEYCVTLSLVVLDYYVLVITEYCTMCLR